MAIFELRDDGLTPVTETTFSAEGVKERADLQRLLRERLDLVATDTLVLAEEFGEWEDSKRRIDLLALDKDANLVVVELKRTEDGGHMELQAIRYAAMVSAMTFDHAVKAHAKFLEQIGREEDAQEAILDFLQWDEPDEEQFAQDVRILLISAEFGKELTTAVMWLNERGLDIRCIRLKPYSLNGRLLIDSQQIIPLPEMADYQVRIREKKQKERAARQQNRDFTKYDVTVGGELYKAQPKRWTIFHIVKYLCGTGISPEAIVEAIGFKSRMFFEYEGKLGSDEYIEKVIEEGKQGGRRIQPGRLFTSDEDLIYFGGMTYAMTKMWGADTVEAIDRLKKAFPDKNFSYQESQT